MIKVVKVKNPAKRSESTEIDQRQKFERTFVPIVDKKQIGKVRFIDSQTLGRSVSRRKVHRSIVEGVGKEGLKRRRKGYFVGWQRLFSGWLVRWDDSKGRWIKIEN